MNIDAYLILPMSERLKESNIQSLSNDDLEAALKHTEEHELCCRIVSEMERRGKEGLYQKRISPAKVENDDHNEQAKNSGKPKGGLKYHKIVAILFIMWGWVFLVISGIMLTEALFYPYIHDKTLHYVIMGLLGVSGVMCVGFGHVLLVVLRHKTT